MATPSMQVCMETSDWLKGIVSEDAAASVDNSRSSSPSAAELISCGPARPQPPLLERRLRPPHDQALKCPRCDSTHTKFCYYNNYSLSQPRYFCKTCRRYWTKGGSLRNVPVGGGCRKNKRLASKKPAEQSIIHHSHQPTDLQLSNLNFMLEGSSHLFMGNCDIGLGDNVSHDFAMNSLGYLTDGRHNSFAEACQRLALPFEAQEEANEVDLKPVNRMLSLEWPDQGCGDSFGYANGIGLWAGMISGHGHGPSSAAM